MHGRSVSVWPKMTCRAEFTRTTESGTLPLHPEQDGSQGNITRAVRGRTEEQAISLWDTKEKVEACNRKTHPQLRKTPEKFINGVYTTQPHELFNSAFQPITAQPAA